MTNNERIKSPDYSELKPEIKFGLSVAQRIREVVMPVYGIKQSDVPINKISVSI